MFKILGRLNHITYRKLYFQGSGRLPGYLIWVVKNSGRLGPLPARDGAVKPADWGRGPSLPKSSVWEGWEGLWWKHHQTLQDDSSSCVVILSHRWFPLQGELEGPVAGAPSDTSGGGVLTLARYSPHLGGHGQGLWRKRHQQPWRGGGGRRVRWGSHRATWSGGRRGSVVKTPPGPS